MPLGSTHIGTGDSMFADSMNFGTGGLLFPGITDIDLDSGFMAATGGMPREVPQYDADGETGRFGGALDFDGPGMG
jgi:hypothetical protein